MKRSTLFSILGGALLVIAVAFPLVYRNDAARIRKTWDQLLAHCEKKPGEHPLASANRATQILPYFVTGAVVEVGAPYPLTLRRADLPALLQQAWARTDRIEVIDRGHTLTFADDHQTAAIEVTMELAVTVAGTRESGLDTYRVRWVRDGKEWRIAGVERLEIVRNPAR